MGYSTGPPIKRTGAVVDGGLTCTACHRTFAPANSDPRGSVRIDAGNYAPGVKQTIRVTVFHPEAQRWGFELTARMVNDETKAAGEFAAGGHGGSPEKDGGRDEVEDNPIPVPVQGCSGGFPVCRHVRIPWANAYHHQ